MSREAGTTDQTIRRWMAKNEFKTHLGKPFVASYRNLKKKKEYDKLRRRKFKEINQKREVFDGSSRKCSNCLEEFPCTEEFFYKNVTKRDGVHNFCIKCDNERRKEYYKENKEEVLAKLRDKYEPVIKPIVIKKQESYVASSWEKKYAEEYLIPNNVEFVWQPNAIETPMGKYCPDFYLPKEDKYIEIKSEYWETFRDTQSEKIDWLVENKSLSIEKLYEKDLKKLGVIK